MAEFTNTQTEIIHEFEIDSMRLEAVRIHQKNEGYVFGKEAISRANVNGTVVHSEKDWDCLYKNRADLPPELENNWLATARPYPTIQSPRVSCLLNRSPQEWYKRGYGPNDKFGRKLLVLRFRT